MFIFGVIGMFLLLKITFNGLQSFLGALLYATFPIIITVMGTGFSNFASVATYHLGILLADLAVKLDSNIFI